LNERLSPFIPLSNGSLYLGTIVRLFERGRDC
jgi:hypothetical protein